MSFPRLTGTSRDIRDPKRSIILHFNKDVTNEVKADIGMLIANLEGEASSVNDTGNKG